MLRHSKKQKPKTWKVPIPYLSCPQPCFIKLVENCHHDNICVLSVRHLRVQMLWKPVQEYLHKSSSQLPALYSYKETCGLMGRPYIMERNCIIDGCYYLLLNLHSISHCFNQLSRIVIAVLLVQSTLFLIPLPLVARCASFILLWVQLKMLSFHSIQFTLNMGNYYSLAIDFEGKNELGK